MFKEDFKFGLTIGTGESGDLVEDARPLLDEFEQRLFGVLTEMAAPDTVFDQTTDEKLCQYCGFRNICRR